jgi:DNA polymerase (family 10)
MALAAREAGYEYLAITDHSASFGFGDDLSPERLREHVAAIRAVRVDGLTLLAGSEVNILPDGRLDYDDEILAELDWVIASAVQHMGEDRATRYLRKFYPWYVERLGGGKAVQAALQTAPTLDAAREILHRESEPARAAAA